MGVRGEIFSTRLILPNRTYFLNVKENRMGDLYLNIVESKNKETGGFERQSVIIFADDLPAFLGEFEKALKVLEKNARDQKSGGRKSRDDREDRGEYKRPERDNRESRGQDRRSTGEYGRQTAGGKGRQTRGGRSDNGRQENGRYNQKERGSRKEYGDKSRERGKRIVVKKRSRD